MRILLILSILLLLLKPAFSKENPSIELICEFEDFYDFEAFKYVDTLLYVANRYGLFIYSYDENNMEVPPVELVRYKTRGETESLLIVDSLCYLADGYAGLRILDISDIYNIQEIGYCEDAANGQFLQLQDDVLYMACGRSYFRSVDVSDPANPTLLHTLHSLSEDFRIHGDLVYSASDDRRYLELIDISDPSNMRTYREVHLGEREDGQGVEIHDDYLYYVTDEKFRIISIVDPDSLEILYEEEYGMRVAANTIHFFNQHYLYMDSYRVWDVTDPTEPVLLFGGWIEMFSDWSEVSEIVSFSCNRKGFYMYNISNLERVEEIHWLPSSGGLSDIYVDDDLMYVTSKYKYGSKFDIYDIEDIHNPIKIGEIDSTEGAGPVTWGFDGIFVQADLAILWAWDGRDVIQIYSIENPRQPNQIGEIGHISSRDLVVDGDYIYAACDGRDGFKVISIANPENPEVVWEMIPPDQYPFDFNGIDLDEDYAYVISRGRDGEWERNFHVWDRSNPENLELIGQCEVEGFEGKVAVSNDYAYVTAVIEGRGLLSVVSVEDPENPELVNTSLLPHYPRDIEIKDDFLYIAFSKIGYFIYDIENPSEPELVTWYDTPYSTGGFSYYNHLFVRDSYVFLPGSIYDVAKVTGHWNVELSAESHDFGVVYLNTDSTYQLTISNLARQDVEILDVFCDSAAFTVDFDDAFVIVSGEDANVNIAFTPTERRLYNGQLTIQTERRDLTLSLSGSGDILDVDDEDLLPLRFALNAAYPNPFNSTVSLQYSIAKNTFVQLNILDVSGRTVSTLQDGKLPSGQYHAVWQADKMPSGIYFVRLTSKEFNQTRKIILVR